MNDYIFSKKKEIFMTVKYKFLANQLRDQIVSGSKTGTRKLPTEAKLCKQYHVSRQTVRQALAILTAEGLIETRQGSGSFITGLSPDPARNTIGLMISTDQEHIYPALIDDIRSALSAAGFSLKIFLTENSVCKERQILEELIRSPLRGLIAEGCKSALPNPNLDLYETLQKSDTSLVFLHNRYQGLESVTCIKDDNQYGGYLLGNYLHHKGHVNIGALFKFDDLQGPERYQGLSSSMRDLGIPLSDTHTGWFSTDDLNNLEKRQNTRFLSDFIQKKLDECTAVVCYNDEIAYWLIRELQYAGYTIPKDMTVVCFDNSYFSELSRIRITALSHNPHEIGLQAADAMIKKCRGLPVTSQEIPWHLITKESDSDIPSEYIPASF